MPYCVGLGVRWGWGATVTAGGYEVAFTGDENVLEGQCLWLQLPVTVKNIQVCASNGLIEWYVNYIS